MGICLARSGILLVITGLVRRMNFELFETGIKDIRAVHDIFVPFVEIDSRGLRSFKKD